MLTHGEIEETIHHLAKDDLNLNDGIHRLVYAIVYKKNMEIAKLKEQINEAYLT